MNSIKRLGILYGRLGLTTDAGLIERRAGGVKASSDALELAAVPALIRVAFGLPKRGESAGFLASFADDDPTFDVQATDKEASLLAAAVLDHQIESETSNSPLVALAVTTASVGRIRRPAVHDGLLDASDTMLAYFQGEALGAPVARTYTKQPETIAAAITAIGNANNNYFNTVSPSVVSAFQELGRYAEGNALVAARNDNEILKYIGRVENELRIFWWVSSGWSTDAAKPFRKLSATEAAVRAGKELADKASNHVGLFAAPAMLDMLLERGRSPDELGGISIKAAAVAGDRSWRGETFRTVTGNGLADLLPISTAMGTAADSDDADDWQPRFERVTAIATATEIDPVELAVQLYRERLVAKALA